jgi:hypothetical protein
MYLMLGIWLAIAFLLFMFRPRALRNNRDHPGKPNNQVNKFTNIYFFISLIFIEGSTS